jgi:hypothetical protein
MQTGTIVDRAGRTLGGLALALGVLGSTLAVCHTVIRIKADPHDYSIEVFGSARRTVLADRVSWGAAMELKVQRVSEGHAALETARHKITEYLVGRGIPAEEVRFAAPDVTPIEERATKDAPLRTIGYAMRQGLTVECERAEPLRTVAQESAELIAAAEIGGGEWVWRPADLQYHYTHLDELKQEVLAEATRNGKVRAAAIAQAAGQRLGTLRIVEFGDIQIRSPGSQNRYTDTDSSPLKDIVADVKLLYHFK